MFSKVTTALHRATTVPETLISPALTNTGYHLSSFHPICETLLYHGFNLHFCMHGEPLSMRLLAAFVSFEMYLIRSFAHFHNWVIYHFTTEV